MDPERRNACVHANRYPSALQDFGVAHAIFEQRALGLQSLQV